MGQGRSLLGHVARQLIQCLVAEDPPIMTPFFWFWGRANTRLELDATKGQEGIFGTRQIGHSSGVFFLVLISLGIRVDR